MRKIYLALIVVAIPSFSYSVLESDESAAADPAPKKRKMMSKLGINPHAAPDEITLKKSKGGKKTGGEKGGFFWKVYWKDTIAGKVFINIINKEPIGPHPSIQIFLNKKSQRKHIGRIAYRLACEQSVYDSIYAHMSKKNIASKKSAEAAGFKVFSSVGQLVLKWARKK